jgi:DNA replication ATP-dependent helicase Dna2
LRGKIDASVQAVVTKTSTKPAFGFKSSTTAGPTTRETPMPFEIKTGRSLGAVEHRAQTMLYTLLMSERYGVDVTSGLLYYTQTEEVVEVPLARNELRGLIMARNELASWMARRAPKDKERNEPAQLIVEVEEAFLPPTIDDERACKRCYVLDTCMLYRKVRVYVLFCAKSFTDVLLGSRKCRGHHVSHR